MGKVRRRRRRTDEWKMGVHKEENNDARIGKDIDNTPQHTLKETLPSFLPPFPSTQTK